MTDYTVTLTASGSTISGSISPSATGGGVNNNAWDVSPNDRVRWTNSTGISGADVTISMPSGFFTNNSQLTVGSSTTTGYKTVASGTASNQQVVYGAFDETTFSFYGGSNYFDKVAGASITAPTISSVTNNNASAANVTATVNLSSNGSGGTLKYAQTTSNSVPATGWQTSASFSHPRGTTRYYWASQDEDTSGAYSSSTAHTVGYIAPDTSTSPNSPTIGSSSSSASVVLSSTTSGETYQLRNSTGQTTYHTATATSGSLTISQTGGLPSAGNTVQYSVYSSRPTSVGGDGAYDFADNYNITRSSFDTEPNQFTFTDVSNVSTSTTQTSNQITISGIDTTVNVYVTNGTYSKNNGSYTSSSGTAVNGDTFRVRHTSSAQNSQPTNTTLAVGDTSDIFTSTTIAGSSSSSSYGIQLFDTDGTTKVLSPDERFGTVIAYSSNVTLDSTTTYVDFVMDMTGISAATTTILLISTTFVNTADYGDTFSFLTDRIRVSKPDGASTFSGDILIVRF
jgi:hypothetical protein